MGSACIECVQIVTSMKELHDERLDIPVLSVCSVVCDVQMIEVIRKESMVTALDPMRLDFILTLVGLHN